MLLLLSMNFIGCFNAEARTAFWDAYLGSHRIVRKYLFGARAMLSICSRTRLESRLAPPLKHIFTARPMHLSLKVLLDFEYVLRNDAEG